MIVTVKRLYRKAYKKEDRIFKPVETTIRRGLR
jgi:hypothetical protein